MKTIKKGFEGFTFVELIIVITILSILGMIGFLSYSGYIVGVRDTSRINQLANIKDSLNLYSLKNVLPLPEERIEIKNGGNIIGYQGYIGKNILETIGYSTKGQDPKDKQYFSYYLTGDKRYFQILGFLEESKSLGKLNLIEKANANIDRYPYTQGYNLGILTDIENNPIQEISTIKSLGSIETTDVGTQQFKSYLNSTEYVKGTGTDFLELKNIAKVGGKKWRVDNNKFVYGGIAGWRLLDPYCEIDDIPIGTQIWAGCNSRLGAGVEYSVDQGCYDYNGNLISGCNRPSNEKENLYNAAGVNNIWGKLYTFANASSACISGYHLPTDEEFTILTDYITSKNLGDVNIGWSVQSGKDETNNLVKALKLPLAGNIGTDGIFSGRGNYLGLWSNTPNINDNTSSYIRLLIFNYSGVIRTFSDQTSSFSVRCIKNP